MELISAQSRGDFKTTGLQSQHSFSFGDYFDPQRLGFSTLRVINEDLIEPLSGFPLHHHRDMEILTYMLAGKLTHTDSLGNSGTLQTDEVQHMSAGRGMRHAEMNNASNQQTHMLQIWLLPNERGIKPSYTQRVFPRQQRLNQWQLLAAPVQHDTALNINSDSWVYSGLLDQQGQLSYQKPAERAVYIHLARGSLILNGASYQQGDGIAIQATRELQMSTTQQAELLLFDLPPHQARG